MNFAFGLRLDVLCCFFLSCFSFLFCHFCLLDTDNGLIKVNDKYRSHQNTNKKLKKVCFFPLKSGNFSLKNGFFPLNDKIH
ncbi:MAG: hypothetical protein EBQ92_12755 [Proteobacteria bacterium]|nr:hypothetical protein [Pseudomonadota bacterium]